MFEIVDKVTGPFKPARARFYQVNHDIALTTSITTARFPTSQFYLERKYQREKGRFCQKKGMLAPS